MSVSISASTVSAYLDCPRMAKYRFTNLDKSVETIQAVIGSIVHEVLAKYWNDKQAAVLFAESLSRSKGLSKSDSSTILKLIDTFFDKFRWMLSENDGIELPFRFNINGITVVGRIDRITETGIIIDWKTSETFIRQQTISTSPQMLIYAEAYTRIYNRLPTAIMVANLKTGTSYSATPDKVASRFLFNSLMPVIYSDMRGTDYNNLPPVGLYKGICKNCQFMDICFSDVGKYNHVMGSSTFINEHS